MLSGRFCQSAVLTLVLTIGVPFVSADTGDGAKPARPETTVAADGDKTPPMPVDFVRDVWPILEARCFSCHGEDAQEGQLRLDARRIVFHGGVSGPAVVPGKSAQSLLVARIIGQGDKDRMPLDDDPLTPQQIAVIRAWIDQGAKWPADVGSPAAPPKRHWAYIKPQRPAVPVVKNRAWVRNPIDAFILARLEREGLSPSAEADRETLLRRVTLDLTGLPPTIEEIEAFLADRQPGAYERVVDRLLASPAYGERWAVPWLDAARFADSNGYQRDGRRENWAFRDWVIDAFNADMPFDRFTIEQIAGDLLPDATLETRIATGFHRNTMANVEAGTDPEEEHVLAVLDRVNTTGTVWLGTSIECGQCHNHKYDPFTQEDYYRLYAFFNNTEKEIETNGSAREFVGPKIDLPLTPEAQRKRRMLNRQIADLKQQVERLTAELESRQAEWERETLASLGESSWQVLQPTSWESLEGGSLRKLSDGSLLAGGNFPPTDIYEVTTETSLTGITAFRVEVLTDPSLPDGGPGRVKPGNFILSEFRVEAARSGNPEDFAPVRLVRAMADFSQKKWPVEAAIDGNRKTGWAIAPQFGKGHYAVFVAAEPVGFDGGTVLRFTLDQQYGNSRTIGRFQLLATTADPSDLGMPAHIRNILATAAEKRDKRQEQQLREFYLGQFEELTALKNKLKGAQDQLAAIRPATTLVMKELPQPRTTRMFIRGNFLTPGKPVEPGTPRVLHPMPPDPQPNRLTLARWLVSAENPLTPRVIINRQWAEFFGRGIVPSVEEFGSQGDPPTHPELLDWLATEFLHRGWSLKAMHRLIVTSATYRQSSHVTPELLKRDPYNTLYARGPRLRLKAEFIRDQALAAAGLLSDRMHGPPVFPYQPPGVWNHIGRASNVWTTSSGENLYRRGLYVYWRRTVPYPSFVNFDAPSREACTVKRSVSNTPLQALTLLNDPVYFEAAVALAGRLLTEPPSDATTEERAVYGFRLVTGRTPSSPEVQVLVHRYEDELGRYRKEPAKARQVVSHGPNPPGVDALELAAWTHVANVLLNLDETITRE